jgi:glucose-1-phosphate cytidylyltransferase
MKLVILAGGFGTRISEESDYIPKPMILIGKKPILWHILKYYSAYGFSEFIICGGYKIEFIKSFFNNFNKKSKDLIEGSWKVTVVNTGKNINTGERLRRVKKYINDDVFCLTYGDGLSNVNINKLIKVHKKNKAVVTLTAVKPESRFGKIIFQGSKISKFLEKDITKESWINGGFFVCDKSLFRYLKKKNTIFESNTLTFLAKKSKLFAFKHSSFWYCMDTLRDKRHLNNLWIKKKAPWKIWND